MSKLSKLLREAMEVKGWSQVELAERSGVPLPSVNRYVNPRFRGQPRRENVLALSRILDIPDDKVLPAIGFPVRVSKDGEERAQRYAEIAALLADDARFDRIAELWQKADDEDRDRAGSMLELAFGKPKPPLRRRRAPRQ